MPIKVSHSTKHHPQLPQIESHGIQEELSKIVHVKGDHTRMKRRSLHTRSDQNKETHKPKLPKLPTYMVINLQKTQTTFTSTVVNIPTKWQYYWNPAQTTQWTYSYEEKPIQLGWNNVVIRRLPGTNDPHSRSTRRFNFERIIRRQI